MLFMMMLMKVMLTMTWMEIRKVKKFQKLLLIPSHFLIILVISTALTSLVLEKNISATSYKCNDFAAGGKFYWVLVAFAPAFTSNFYVHKI